MGYWGWRPLLFAFVISVWVTGCNTVQQSAPVASPTQLPLITLRVATPASLATDSAPGLPVLTTSSPAEPPPAAFSLTAIAPNDQPLSLQHPLTLPAPTCYETTGGGVLCLGRLDNTGHYPVGQVVIALDILDRDGEILRGGEVVIEQHLILPGQSAPYRMIFPADTGNLLAPQFGGVAVRVLQAIPVTVPTNRLAALSIQSRRIPTENDRYAVHLVLTNAGPEDAPAVRVIVTLYDEAGRVVGYRLAEIPLVPAGESVSRRVEMIPVTVSDGLYHTVQMEIGQ